MSIVLNEDIVKILKAKLDKTEMKYPVNKFKGVSLKHNKL